MTVKKTLKKNPYIYSIIKWIRKLQLVYLPYIQTRVKFTIKRFLRITHLHKNSRYEKLKNIKNKHQDERCFIIATGPSLTIEDLEKLKSEVTFGMNSICLAFNETTWRPTYYGIQDEGVYGKMREHIEKLNIEGKFISDTVLNIYDVTIGKRDYIFPLNMLHHNISNNFKTKFSSNIFSTVNSGNTITYCLLQIAVYMGFKEIYLLGADCHYGVGEKHHFREYDLVDPTFELAQDMMTASYKEAKRFADKNNIKIYNATRGGKLEIFERVNLDEILKSKKLEVTAL